MKRKKIIITLIVVLAAAAALTLSQYSKWSEKSFEAVVKGVDERQDGETRLIVERVTEIYGDPLNSLRIGEDTKLIDGDGKDITVEEIKQGVVVEITLKDAFTEETPFYYPVVYKIRIINSIGS